MPEGAKMEGYDDWNTKSQAGLPLTMSQLLNVTSSSRESPASSRKGPNSPQKKKTKLTEIRPKGSVVIVTQGNPIELRRKHHAQAQKQQRDRMKAALDRIAQIMEVGGVREGTNGTKVELLETAVEYIQVLQGHIEELRGRGSRHATG